MEAMVIRPAFWRGRRVLLTGHTGFKGAWTTLLLHRLGAEVCGFALPPEHDDGVFRTTGAANDLLHRVGDINDVTTVKALVAEFRPEIVLHMAAQALVRRSYAEPVDTYRTNVMGTVHVLEAVRQVDSVGAVIVVTSDKCYENTGSSRAYHEADALGGTDPYSSSKACAELVTESYRRSFFSAASAPPVASVRAGNVIGGGDRSSDRLVPDAVRAFRNNEPLRIRNPRSVRPWQHVLDPVLGYLLLAERLISDGQAFAQAWNFGPEPSSEVTVGEVADHLVRRWGVSARWCRDGGEHPHEAAYLRLDSSKAKTELGWRPLLPLEQSLDMTVEWYRQFDAGGAMREVTLKQIDSALDRSVKQMSHALHE
jgi:CDP-glucose 4,6-dehydratase